MSAGLDSTTAMHLVATLRQLAQGGRAILTTIHQPSSRLYQMLDKLLLLSEGYATLLLVPLSKFKSCFHIQLRGCSVVVCKAVPTLKVDQMLLMSMLLLRLLLSVLLLLLYPLVMS